MFDRFPAETTYGYPFPERREQDAAYAAFVPPAIAWEEAPLALYVHVPYCVHLCQFCGFVREPIAKPEEVYGFVDAMLLELELLADRLGRRRLDAIFFGGGTASTLTLNQVERILDRIEARFVVAADAERTFEGECLTLRRPGYTAGLATLGFERLSFGVQIMDEGARSVLNLRPDHSALSALAADAATRFADVAVDYIVGWPAQDAAAVTADIGRLIANVPTRSVELFTFEVLDAEPSFVRAMTDAGARPLCAAELQATRRAAIDALGAAGFQQQGHTVFKRTPAAPRPTSYGACYYGWGDGGVIGIGRGAQSFVDGQMWGNAVSPTRYRESLARGILPIADLGRYHRGERERVTWPRRGWIGVDRATGLEEFVAHGYVQIDGDRYVLTRRGDDWVPALLDALMPSDQRARKEQIARARQIERGIVPLDTMYRNLNEADET